MNITWHILSGMKHMVMDSVKEESEALLNNVANCKLNEDETKSISNGNRSKHNLNRSYFSPYYLMEYIPPFSKVSKMKHILDKYLSGDCSSDPNDDLIENEEANNNDRNNNNNNNNNNSSPIQASHARRHNNGNREIWRMFVIMGIVWMLIVCGIIIFFLVIFLFTQWIFIFIIFFCGFFGLILLFSSGCFVLLFFICRHLFR